MKKNVSKIREREGNEKRHSRNSGTGRECKKAFPKLGNGKGMKKSIPIIREWESEAFILGNGREREFPLTPALQQIFIIFSFSLVLSKTPLPTNNGFQWILA